MENYLLIFIIGAVLSIIATCIVCKIDFFKKTNGKKVKGKGLIIIGSWLFFPFIYGESTIGLIGLLFIIIGLICSAASRKKNKKAKAIPVAIPDVDLTPVKPINNHFAYNVAASKHAPMPVVPSEIKNTVIEKAPTTKENETIAGPIIVSEDKSVTKTPASSIQPEKAPQPTATSIENITEIKKFKELLDMGAITQDEFDAKKKELLSL